MNTKMSPFEALSPFESLPAVEPALGDARIARKTHKKTRQICKEVSRTLSCSLGASRDALIRDLAVVSVDPAPDAARLLVTVCAMSSEPAESAQRTEQLLGRLRELRGQLRSEVAAVLQRKRTPDLTFRVAFT